MQKNLSLHNLAGKLLPLAPANYFPDTPCINKQNRSVGRAGTTLAPKLIYLPNSTYDFAVKILHTKSAHLLPFIIIRLLKSKKRQFDKKKN